MSEKVLQQVSVSYNSDIENIPGELKRIAGKYNCNGFQSKGTPDLKNIGVHIYDFSWPISQSENALNFAKEINSLEKTVAICIEKF